MGSPRLLARLLLAVGGAAACSRSPIRPEPEGNAGGAPGALRQAEGKSGSGAGPTALCQAGMACVPGSRCGYHTSSVRGPLGPPSMQCQCSQAGVFACPRDRNDEASAGRAPVICLPKQGECLTAVKPLGEAITQRFQVSCPPFFLDDATPPTVKKNSAGADECCYTGSFGDCEGRPLWVEGELRHSPLHRSRWG